MSSGGPPLLSDGRRGTNVASSTNGMFARGMVAHKRARPGLASSVYPSVHRKWGADLGVDEPAENVKTCRNAVQLR